MERKRRRKTVKNVKEYENAKFEDFKGIWKDVLGTPERHGFWLVYGREKHGKSWLNLMLAKMIHEYARTLYISAEEGFSEHFKGTMDRLSIDHNSSQLYFENEKLTIRDIEDEFEYKNKDGKVVQRRNAIEVVILDNLLVYLRIWKPSTIQSFFDKWSKKKLIIFVAHEDDKGDLVGAISKLVSQLAIVKFRVEGLNVNVSGRCPGGNIVINEERAALYHGQSIVNNQIPQ